ncbi:unnamed protein product [Bursaphelenchus okinawaensis]|uniref:Uncharacterized protein n=1 Tax=Bursaphelenchus okinawaensis TaxID=465554 RepID=A0A811LF24_9BILA|nr:unnamed protein product [Bursaphelenchus okinawaensis]CAG9121848.1 unnamed protein product [Bursaphelenchus okinawaensis]
MRIKAVLLLLCLWTVWAQVPVSKEVTTWQKNFNVGKFITRGVCCPRFVLERTSGMCILTIPPIQTGNREDFCKQAGAFLYGDTICVMNARPPPSANGTTNGTEPAGNSTAHATPLPKPKPNPKKAL